MQHTQQQDPAAASEIKPVRFIRKPEVIKTTGLSHSQLYRLIAKGEFPAQVKLTEITSAWIEAEVAQWCADRIAASRPQQDAA